MVVNVLMARLLGPAARGEVAWVLQASYFLIPALALGVDRVALRSAEPDRSPPRWHVWAIGSVAAAGAMIGGSLELAAAFVVACAGAALTIERAQGIYTGRLGRYISLQLGMQVWIVSASIVLYVAGVASVSSWIAVYAVPAVGVLGSTLVVWLRRRRATKSIPRWSQHRAAAALVPGAIAVVAAARVERLLLPLLASPAALGLYVAVATASEMLQWVAQGLSESSVRDHRGRLLARRGLARIAGKALVVYGLLSLILAAAISWLLLPLLGPAFSPAQQLVIPACLASASWAAYRHVSAAWVAAEVGRSSVLEVCGALLTTGLALVAIPIAGALGAAIASLGSHVIMIVVAVACWPSKREAL